MVLQHPRLYQTINIYNYLSLLFLSGQKESSENLGILLYSEVLARYETCIIIVNSLMAEKRGYVKLKPVKRLLIKKRYV